MKIFAKVILATLALTVLANCSTPVKSTIVQASSNSVDEQFKGDGLDLKGTFLMPAHATGPVPAMLLLPGSGPTDRDGNAGNGLNVPKIDSLKQVAEALAQHGIASFRFDKRALLEYGPSWPTDSSKLGKFFSYQHFVNDATDAYSFLKAHAGVDSKRVGILGHSEGGLFALQIGSDLAKTNKVPWKLVLMSAAGRPMGSVIHDQLAYQLKNGGASADITNQYLSWWDKAADAIVHDKPLPPNMPPHMDGLVNPSTSEIMKAYVTIDPAKLMEATTQPVLIMNGGDDIQVNPEKDAGRLAQAMRERKGNPGGELKIIPKVSHNYKSTATGGPSAFEGPMSPEALDAIVKFLQG